MSAVRSQLEIEQAEKAFMSKKRKAGMNLGCIYMKNHILGRPSTDFEIGVLLLKKSGSEVGDLNHSRKFPAALRQSVRKLCRIEFVSFFLTPMESTDWASSSSWSIS